MTFAYLIDPLLTNNCRHFENIDSLRIESLP